jgi:hypothetical protein
MRGSLFFTGSEDLPYNAVPTAVRLFKITLIVVELRLKRTWSRTFGRRR